MSATAIFSLNHRMRICHHAKSWEYSPAEGTGTQSPKPGRSLREKNDINVPGLGEQRVNGGETGAHHARPHRVRNLQQRAKGR